MDSSKVFPEKYDFSKMETDTTIEEFFTKEEYKNMCDLEKKRYKNLRLNYEMMLQFGTKTWRPPFRPPSATVTSATAKVQTAAKSGGKEKRTTSQKVEKPKEERREYSFRKRREVNYMKLEVPNNDEFIYCEECDQEYQGDCPEHGPFHVVDDTPVEVKKRGDPQRAMKTLPAGLEVRQSGIPNAGLGLFATQFFPTRSRFGPYGGRRVTDSDIAHSSGYCWQICTDEGYNYFVDAKDCKTANWMKYVNCARTRAEQNVTAYQHCGEVYYRAHCDIQPGTEVLVWYGTEYGEELGIIREDDEPKKKKRSSVTQKEPVRDEETDEHLTCSDSDARTSDIELSDSDDSDRQQTTCKKPKLLKKLDQLSTSVTTTSSRHPSSTSRPSPHKSASTSGSLLSQDRSHVCQHCSAAFVLFNSLKLHTRFVHGQELQAILPVSATPDRCDAGKRDNMKEKVHNVGNVNAVERMKDGNDNSPDDEKDQTKGRRHVCDVCSKAFTRADSLKTHKLIHDGYKPFVCDLCSKAFTQAGHLKTHKLIHEGHKQFVCDVCSKAFTQASTLKRHKLIHDGHKQFVCDVCSKAFTQAVTLKRHKRIHTGERPYMCPHCDADFNRSSHLQRHIRSKHAGDRPYVCDVCGEAFSQTGDLKKHKRTHTGEKPYSCDICGAAFSQTGNLKTHKRIHTGDKPHVCTDCGRGFAQSSYLKNHRLIHTGEKPHSCPHCPAASTRSSHLKRHIEKLHQ